VRRIAYYTIFLNITLFYIQLTVNRCPPVEMAKFNHFIINGNIKKPVYNKCMQFQGQFCAYALSMGQF
jgi:hypothetical protein